MQLSLKQIQTMLNIQAYAPKLCEQDIASIEVQSVCRDTNDVQANSLFVCIVGARFDGHDFAQQAVNGGAVVLLVSRVLPEISVPQLVVEDTVKALGMLAHAWRDGFEGKLIAITGSAGKTTLKECLAQVLLHAHKKVACSILNYNNQIGLPLSILSTTGNEDYWIMEAGISQPHDMDELGAILEPDMVLILNAGHGHTEGLGLKGVAYHKAQLLKYIKNSCSKTRAFVSADYTDLVLQAQKICKEICFFSAHDNDAIGAKYSAKYMGLKTELENKDCLGSYLINFSDQSVEVITSFCGSYGAENIAAVTAIAHSLGIKMQDIIKALTCLNFPKQRFNIHNLGSWCIIDDSYNANVLSMGRMLEACVQQARGGPCYVVLGAMGELGNLACTEHKNLGHMLATLPINTIFWVGPYAEDVLSGLREKHFDGEFIIINDVNDFSKKWQDANLAPGTILFKGSRSNALEKYVHIILAELESYQAHLRGDHAL